MATQTANDKIVDLTKISSIDDLFLALRASFQGARIKATDVKGREFELHVKELMHEDGSGRSFVIRGSAKLIRTPKMKVNGLGSKKFKAYLNYKGGSRKGWIKIDEKPKGIMPTLKAGCTK